MNMIADPPDPELPKKRTRMLHSTLGEQIIEERLERNQTRMLSVLIVTRKDIRRPIVGPRAEERRGKAPKAKEKKEKEEPKKALANAAEDEDGVWMAVTDMSESEDMVDSEFNNFTISDEDLFFFEDEDRDGNVLDLTTRLK